MDLNFNDLIDILDGEEFDERPVDLRTFVTSPDYLGLPPLSEYQYTLIEKSSQIYKESTLIKLFGEEEGKRRFKQTCNEVIAQLGKGSGKDYCSTISVSYIVYLLLCLKDPATYYGKPPGDTIDIINIAVNAAQANNVFFKGFKTRIDRSPWFTGKYDPKASEIRFDKSVNVYSGHSEREAFEGYNVIAVILDEISGFATENTTGHDQAKTADAIYDMYRGSVVSRFPDYGKVILLSFPRFKNDPIQKFYDSVVAEKETIIRTKVLKMDENLPDGTVGNEVTVEWEEDNIISYTIPKTYAIKRPTWEINPTKKIEDFKVEFYKNMPDALSRFACMPPEAVDAFFKSREKIEKAFSNIAAANKFSFNIKQIRSILSKAAGCKVIDEHKNGGYATPAECAGSFLTYISRIRKDPTKNAINLWIVSDNLLKGAAFNGVQIAEVLVKKYINFKFKHKFLLTEFFYVM